MDSPYKQNAELNSSALYIIHSSKVWSLQNCSLFLTVYVLETENRLGCRLCLERSWRHVSVPRRSSRGPTRIWDILCNSLIIFHPHSVDDVITERVGFKRRFRDNHVTGEKLVKRYRTVLRSRRTRTYRRHLSTTRNRAAGGLWRTNTCSLH